MGNKVNENYFDSLATWFVCLFVCLFVILDMRVIRNLSLLTIFMV